MPRPAIKFKFKKLAVLLISAACLTFFAAPALAQSYNAGAIALGLNSQIQTATGLGNQDIRITIANIIRIALSFLGITTLVLMIYAGFLWMTAGGNDEQISSAKKIIRNAVIGLAIILSAYAIVSFVINGLLQATSGLPSHCFNGIQDFDETGVDTGGSCGLGSGGGGVPPGTNSLFVVSLPSAGNVCVANYHPVITFNRPVDLTSFSQANIYIESASGQMASGSWAYANAYSKDSVAFTAQGSCGGQAGNDCFPASSDYHLVIVVDPVTKISSIKSLETDPANALNLRCDLKAGCGPVFFKTGSGVDRTPPTVSFLTPLAGSTLAGGGNIPVDVRFNDDTGVQTVQLYTASGTPFTFQNNFTSQYLSSAPKYSISSGAVGDIDNDGNLDLITDGSGQRAVTIYKGDGAGNFSRAYTVNFPTIVYFVRVADVNGDGRLDIIADGQIDFYIALGNGDGTFGPPTRYSHNNSGRALYVADLNNDGRPDVVTFVGPTPPSIQVFINKGDGTFGTPTSYSVNFNDTLSRDLATSGDFNGDGKTDLAIVDYTNSGIQLLTGNGDGTFTKQPTIPVLLPAGTSATPASIVSADFDRDGKLDIAMTNFWNNSLSISFGHGDGTFSSPVFYNNVPTDPNDIAVTDLNSDGYPDLVVSTLLSGPSGADYTLLNTGTGAFQPPRKYQVSRSGNGSHSTDILVGDFNSDTFGDFAAIYDDTTVNESGLAVFNSNHVNNGLTYSLVDSQSFNNCQLNGVAHLTWNTASIPGGPYALQARGLDYAAQVGLDNRNVTLRPGSCYNNVLDPGEDQVGPPACGASSVCGACAGGSCRSNADCASNFCYIAPGQSQGICINKAKITDYSPRAAGLGSFVTVKGYYFGATPGTVFFARRANPNPNNLADWVPASIPACGFSGWSDRQIIVEVPPGVASGPIMVSTSLQTGADGIRRSFVDTTNQEGLPDFTLNSDLLPGICAVTPAQGAPGDTVVITGQRFGLLSSIDDYVMFGQLKGTTQQNAWKDDQINTQVANLGEGYLALSVFAKGKESNRVEFSVLGTQAANTPVITSITPTNGANGEYITISGNNFGTQLGQVWFKQNANSQAILGDFVFPTVCNATDLWQDNRIIVKFPKGAGVVGTNYLVQVKPADAKMNASAINNNIVFTLNAGQPAPGLCKIDPVSATVPFGAAQVAHLYGEYFSATNPINSINRNNLTLYYSFNKDTFTGTNVTDGSGANNNGTVVGGPTLVGGVYDEAVNFDISSDQHLEVPNGAGLNNATQGSIAFWVKWVGNQPKSGKIYGAVISREESAVFSNFVIGLSDPNPVNGHIVWQPFDNSNAAIVGNTAVGDSIWHHVVITFQSGSHTLYLDGKVDGTGNTAGTFANRPGVPLLIGRWLAGSQSQIDDMVVYTRILTAQEVQALYNNAAGVQVYFWKSGASPTAITGRTLAAVVGGGSTVLNVKPPADTQSGPVVAYRPGDQKISNPVPFTVLDCVKNNNMCGDPNLKCCTAGGDVGACKLPQDLCAGETRSTGYVWRFSTKDIPEIPHVVERCDAVTEAGQALPTPSPSVQWKFGNSPTSTDAQFNVCRGALATVEFTMALDPTTVSAANVGVYKCTVLNPDGSCRTWTPVALNPQSYNLFVAFQNANVTHDYLSLQPAANKWDDNAWYQVVLGSGIRSFAVTGNSANLSIDKPCNDATISRSAYCFTFHTDTQDCTLRAVVITPYAYFTSYLEKPMLTHNPDGTVGAPVQYAGNGLSSQRCIMMDMSAYNWAWDTQKPNNTTFADIFGPSNLRLINVSSLLNTKGIAPNDAVNVNGTASHNADVKTGASPLTIDLTHPEVVEVWPTCLEACTNAEVGARFNITMNNRNLPGSPVGGTVQVLECRDENCLSTVAIMDPRQVFLDPTSGFTVLKIDNSTLGATPLKADTKYQVILSAVTAPGITSPNQLWSSYKFGDPSPANAGVPYNKVYTWSFKTKKQACTIERVAINPTDFYAKSITDRASYAAQPYSAPDSCSPDGQKLNPWSVDWQWASADTNVARVQTFSTKLGNPNCTQSCTRKGSDIPADNPNPMPVCGNGKVEAGEECDSPNKNNGCGLDCRRTGNPAATCGDGIVEPNLGETCDINDPQTKVGCSNTCIHLGSTATPNPNNPNLSICGNGTVGSGEDCDLGIPADINNPQSALGCTAQCLHQGTKLAKFWCQTNRNNGSFGNFLQNDFEAACATSYSICGDGFLDGDEDLGCDGGGGWNSNLCSNYCLLKAGDSATDITGNSCGNNGANIPEGCNSTLQHLGSSLLYSVPSACGDGIVGIGEDATCEVNLSGKALLFNPWVLATGVGNGPVNKNVSPPEQRTKITGSTNENTKNNAVVGGSGNFVIQCGYQADNQCSSIDPNLGLGSDTCCYARPKLISTFPVTSTPIQFNVCPNTLITATFNQVIDAGTLAGNVLIAQGSDSPCAPGLTEVTNQLADARGLTPRNSDLAWYQRLFHTVGNFVKSLFGLTAEAVISPNPVHWCTGNDVGSATVTVDPDRIGFSTVNVALNKPLAYDSNYAVILTPKVKSVQGVSVGARALYWKFNTANQICTVNDVTVTPSTVYFGRAGATSTLSAFGTYTNPQGKKSLLQSIPGYYAWQFLWGPEANDYVRFSATTTNLTTVLTAQNKNGEIDVRAAAQITQNSINADQGIVATGKSHVIVFLCENPWPPKRQFLNNQGPFLIFPYEDTLGNNDNYDMNTQQFNNVAIPPTQFLYDGYFNFRTDYCADAGGPGTADDLPYLQPTVQTTANQLAVLPNTCEISGDTCNADADCGIKYTTSTASFIGTAGSLCASTNANGLVNYYTVNGKALGCGNVGACNADNGFANWIKNSGGNAACVNAPEIAAAAKCYANRPLKRFFFTNQSNTDSIGIQIFENRDFLSAEDWFRADRAHGGQGFSGQLSHTTIGGYPAVTDGNNYYVEALNYAKSLNGLNQVRNNIFSTIYLFSINADAKTETRQVFDQMRQNLSFNTNLTNYGYCGVSVANPGFSQKCSNDFDCPTGQVCSDQVDKLRRNYQRLHDLRSLETAINNYATVNGGAYPDLNSGSFLAGQTLSVWPQSWTLLGNQIGGVGAPVDPVNQLGRAGTCTANPTRYCQTDAQCQAPDTCTLHDAQTGWSVADRRFSFACNVTSLAYRYIFSSPNSYQIRAQSEDPGVVVDNQASMTNYFIDSKVSFGGASGICTANQEVSSLQSGRCGDGVVNLNKGEQCDPPGTIQYGACGQTQANLIKVDVCNSTCQWVPSSTPFVSCNALSTCGNGKREGTETCDDGGLNGKIGHCNNTCTGFTNTCGNSRLDPGELCEITDVNNAARRGWCIGGAAPLGTSCNPANGNADCNGNNTYNGICYSIDQMGEKYGITRAASCGFDCQSAGPYCGDGQVQPSFGEECDGSDTACTVGGVRGVRTCNNTCQFSDLDAKLWLRFTDGFTNNPITTFVNSGSIGGTAACTATGNTCPDKVMNEKFGNALNFGNHASRVYYVDNPALDSTTSFSLEAWVNPLDDGTQNSRIIEKGGWLVAAGYGLEFNLANTDKVRFNIWSDSRTFNSLDSISVIPKGSWTHIVATYDRQVVKNQSIQIMRLYINGVKDNERIDVNRPNFLPNLFTTATSTFNVGNASNSTNSSFPGMIDEVRYYARALQGSEALDHFNNVWVCKANLPPEVAQAGAGICGDGRVDANEACDTGGKNGVACNAAYGKSCTYCSADCHNIVTVEANQFCGNGQIEKGEFCDTDPNTGIIYAAQNVPGKTQAQLSHGGYQALACSAETSDQYTAKKGTKVCSNSCTRIIAAESQADGCIVCGYTGITGETITGDIINALEPLSFNPLYGGTNPNGATLALTMSTSYNSLVAGWHQYAVGSDTNYSLSPPSEDELLSANLTHVEPHPLCSVASDPTHYRMFVNNDNAHAIDFKVFTDPKNVAPWRYDLLLSPIIPRSGLNGVVVPNDANYGDNTAAPVGTANFNLPATARPNDVRVVLSWDGVGSFVVGIVRINSVGVVTTVESNSLPPSPGLFYYRLKSSWLVGGFHTGGIWNHGAGDTPNDSHTIAMTFDTWSSQQSAVMQSSQYYVYVRTADNAPIANLINKNVRLDLYVSENDNNQNHFARPTQTFLLSGAQPSDNKGATMWQVFNLNRADVARSVGAIFDFIPDPQTQAFQLNGRIITDKTKLIGTQTPLAPPAVVVP